MEPPLRAAGLAELLQSKIFDVEDAARFLGVTPGDVYQQMYWRRIAYVQYGSHRYFAVADLCDYLAARGPGSASRIQMVQPFEVAGVGANRVAREIPAS